MSNTTEPVRRLCQSILLANDSNASVAATTNELLSRVAKKALDAFDASNTRFVSSGDDLQATINAAAAKSSVLLPVCIEIGAGVFVEDVSIPANTKGLTIKGSGMYATILKSKINKSKGSATITIGTGCENIGIHNLGLIQNADGVESLIDFGLSTRVTVSGCSLRWDWCSALEGTCHELDCMNNVFDAQPPVSKDFSLVTNGADAGLTWTGNTTAPSAVSFFNQTTRPRARYDKCQLIYGIYGADTWAARATFATAKDITSLGGNVSFSGMFSCTANQPAGTWTVNLYSDSDYAAGHLIGSCNLPLLTANAWEYVRLAIEDISGTSVKGIEFVHNGAQSEAGSYFYVNDLWLEHTITPRHECYLWDVFNKPGSTVSSAVVGDGYSTDNLSNGYITFANNEIGIRTYGTGAGADKPLTLGVIRFSGYFNQNSSAQPSMCYFNGNRVLMRGRNMAAGCNNITIEPLRLIGVCDLVAGGNAWCIDSPDATSHAGGKCWFAITHNSDAILTTDFNVATKDITEFHTFNQINGAINISSGWSNYTADIVVPSSAALKLVEKGMQVYDKEANLFKYFDGTIWKSLAVI